MKIAIVTDRFGPGSGTAGQAYVAASGLRQRHEVTVWARRGASTLDGVDVQVRGWFGSGGKGSGIRIAFDRVAGCEVVRASGGVHLACVRACGRRVGVRDRITSAIERTAVRRARLVICNSEKVASEVAAFHGVDPRRIRVLRNGVDLDRFRPDPGRRARMRAAWGVPDGGRVALFLAHGFRRKNLLTAAAAFAEAAEPRDRLVIAGRDAHARRWLREARAHAGERMVVAGSLALPEDALASADALLHPTLYDASANVVLEAMACGVPPITTVADGASEVVPDRSIVVQDALEVAEVAAALERAWTLGPGPSWRAAAETWPDSRMVAALEELLGDVATDDP
jgi:UDP-glucose:(heptosyl)LPS alpha-1,3-glucosyltransferase